MNIKRLPKAFVGQLKSYDKKRLVRLVLIILLLTWIVAFFIVRTSSSRLKSDLNEVRTQLQSDTQKITDIPDPSSIEKGQLNSSLETIITSSRELANAETSSLPPRTLLILQKPLDESWRTEVSKLNEVNDLDTETSRLLNHHANVLETIGQVLRYNPQADLSSPTLSQDEITSRITGAQEGISATQSALASIQPYSKEDDVEGLAKILDELQVNLKKFDSSRDVDVWYKDVADAQGKIIDNRASFWKSETEMLLNKYAIIQQNYSTVINKL